jgi:cell division protein FtsN
MRSAFQNEQDEAIDRPGVQPGLEQDLRAEGLPGATPDRELTVSATTLLAIFFGLVLLCGLFFGLGYAFGRRTPADPVAAAQAPVAASSFATQSKPSAAAQSVGTLPTPAEPPPQPAGSSLSPDAAPPDDTAPSQPEAPASSAKQTPADSDASTPAAPGTMVQIAAVSNPADADVLVRALLQHGYSASARRFPPDPLIHVQIGPFGNRADAVAMKQKLLNDGYNAILK